MKVTKNIVVFVSTVRDSYVDALRLTDDNSYRVMLLRDSRLRHPEYLPEIDILVECDFSRPEKIAEALLPYRSELLAITCRTEQHMARFAQIIPHVPYLRTPTAESLEWATDKYKMRRRLKLYDPKNTPKFTKIADTTKKERERVIERIGFPLVIKPSNLAASRFVTICYHEEEFEKVVKNVFRRIKKAYDGDRRVEEPTIMAEEYMEGQQYSIDSYVDSRGTLYHCPMVRQKTGREIGHDDYYSYLQTTPTALKRTTVEAAERVVESAVHALGLRSVTAHVELMKIDDEWRVIEVAPRVGGFRDVLHRLSCDINHYANDILIRVPRKPIVPKKCKGFAAVMKWFVDKEGIITEMKGVKKIEELESFHEIHVNKKIGDRAVFARNGGRSIFNLFLYNKDRSKLLADIRRVEQMVEVKVSSGRKPVTKKAVKKKTTKVTPKKTVAVSTKTAVKKKS